MKSLLPCTLLPFTTISAFAQGMLIFANNSATTITNCITGLPAVGGPAQDDTQVGLYVGNVGDSVSSLTLIGNVTNCFSAGRFSGGTRSLPGWTGLVQLQVRAWLSSTVYPSYESAVAGALGGDAFVLLGVSSPFNFTLTQPPTPPISIITAGLTPIIIGPLTCVPEPSSLLLGFLTLGGMVLFRARCGW